MILIKVRSDLNCLGQVRAINGDYHNLNYFSRQMLLLLTGPQPEPKLVTGARAELWGNGQADES